MGTDGVKNDATGRPAMGLRLAVLSRGPRLYSTRRIVEEAKKRGLDVEAVSYTHLTLPTIHRV